MGNDRQTESAVTLTTLGGPSCLWTQKQFGAVINYHVCLRIISDDLSDELVFLFFFPLEEQNKTSKKVRGLQPKMFHRSINLENVTIYVPEFLL